MDGFEANKVLMAVILALLIGMLASKIAEITVSPHILVKNVVEIDGVEDTGIMSSTAATEDKLEPVEPLLAAANIPNGEKIARKCLQCHTLDKGGKANVGPNLWGIVGNKFAHMQGFSYSKGLQEKVGQWTYENLNAFIHKPKQFIVGTKMSFIGLPKITERADLIAYLRTLSDSPLPLPNVSAAPMSSAILSTKITSTLANQSSTVKPTAPIGQIQASTIPQASINIPAQDPNVLSSTSTTPSTTSPVSASNNQ